ncbi:ribosome hibernation-promoting factor, HPF/YfiA family [Candidatus Latescibacterota bacterium]
MTRNEDFSVQITTLHDDLTEPYKESIRVQLQKLSRYYPTIIDAKVIINRQNSSYRVDVSLQVPGCIITGKHEDFDLSKAVDTSINKVKVQVKKLRDKIVDHKAQPKSAQIEEIREDIRDE